MFSKSSSGLLRSFSQWQLSTVPVAAAMILFHAVGIPALQAQERSAVSVQTVNQTLPALASLGTPGLDEDPEGLMTPLQAGMPQIRNAVPPPSNLAVSPERQAEVLATARAQQHDFHAQNGGARAIHPGFGLDLQYTSEGMTLRPRGSDNLNLPTKNWSAQFSTNSITIDEKELEAPEENAAILFTSNRVRQTIAQGASEWWINAEGGPEHGFTIEKSTHSDPRNLSISLALSSTLTISQEENTILFKDQNERSLLSYSKLLVHDANNRVLPSQMKLQKRDQGWSLTLQADLTDSVFPITVDPVIGRQQEETLASDGASGDEFGFASDGLGEVMAVSSPGKGSGKVYLFHENHGGAGAWNEKTSVVIPASETPVNGDRFGQSLAIFEDETIGKTYLAVGAPEHDGTGSVFIYERNQGGPDNWGFVEILQDGDLSSGDQFGTALDGLGNTLAAGAPGHNAGAVFLFEVSGGSFSRNQKVTTPAEPGQTPSNTDEFGAAVALGGDHMVIGAPGENSENGGAYLFKRSSPYIALFRLFSDKSEAGARFGAVVAIAITGLLLAIGMPFDDVSATLVDAGSVFIYAVLATTLAWGFLAAIFGTEAGALFGSALALNFFFDLAVGAPGATSTTSPLKVGGAVFIFLFSRFLFAYGAANKIVPSSFIDVGMALGTSLVLLGTALFVLGAAYSFSKGAMFLFILAATILTFPLWQQFFWTQDQIDNHPEESGPMADPDGDGLVNKVEFAMLLIPILFSTLAALGLVISGGKYHFIIQENRAAFGVLLLIQYSLLLNNWFSLGSGPFSGQLSIKVLHDGIQARQLQLTISTLVALNFFTRVTAQ